MLRFWITSEARRRFAGHHHGRLAGTSLGETAEPLNTSPSLAGTPLLRRTPQHHHGRLAGTPPRVPSQARRRFARHRTTITGGSQARRPEFPRRHAAASQDTAPPSRGARRHAAQSFVARYSWQPLDRSASQHVTLPCRHPGHRTSIAGASQPPRVS